MKILLTSGGTKVPIDMVRNITNMSSGTFGSKIGTELLKLGHELVFYKSKGSKTPLSTNINLMTGYDIKSFSDWYNKTSKYISKYTEYEYSTYDQYAEGLKFIIGVEQPNVIVLAAAVSDYGVENYFNGKLRCNDMFNIKLKQLPKLINRIKEWSPKSKLVGFKLLVNSRENQLFEAAKRSIIENQCDMVIANDLDDIKNNNHIIRVISENTSQSAQVIKCLTPVPSNCYNVVTYKSSEQPDNPNYLAEKVANHIIQL